MMIIRRIPMNALQKGVYSILMSKQEGNIIPVYDDVPEYQLDIDGNPLLDEEGSPIPVKLPYVTLGEFTYKRNGTKDTDIGDASQQLHIWSEYKGKKEVNQIADDLTAILTSWAIDLSDDGFKVIEQDVDFFEAFPEEVAGYHGVITFTSKIQNLGG
jgi:hypothetical protein